MSPMKQSFWQSPLTRLAMMKYGVKDIRDLNSGSLTRLAQFTDDE